MEEIESHRVLGNGFWVDHVHRATSWSGSRNKSNKIKSHSGVPNKKIESHRLSLPILEESELNFSPKFNSFAPGRVVGGVKRVSPADLWRSLVRGSWCPLQGGSHTKLKSEAAADPASPT